LQVLTLAAFLTQQQSHLQYCAEQLSEFRANIMDVVQFTCQDALDHLEHQLQAFHVSSDTSGHTGEGGVGSGTATATGLKSGALSKSTSFGGALKTGTAAAATLGGQGAGGDSKVRRH
jgi:hypothetical protein